MYNICTRDLNHVVFLISGFILCFSPPLIALSTHEQALGEYLTAYSETEFTQAGDVMKKAGKVYETSSSDRQVHLAKYMYACMYIPVEQLKARLIV